MNNEKEIVTVEKDLSTNVKKEIGFWRELGHQARLVYYLLRDPEVPFYLKLVPFIGVVYLVFPLDFVPDMFIGLGQLDDLTVLLIGSKIFIELAPPHIVAKHRQAIRFSDGYGVADDFSEAIVIDSEHEVVMDTELPSKDK